MPIRRRVRTGLLAALAALCVSPLELPSASATPAPSRLLVTGREYSLQLSRSVIAPGDSIVQFLNSGEDSHNLVLQRVGGTRVFDAGIIEPGGLGELDLSLKRGATYVLFCSLAEHRALGMEAELKVGNWDGTWPGATASRRKVVKGLASRARRRAGPAR